MAKDNRDLLTVLKTEMAFLEKGAYRNPDHAGWRPQLIFQDSPTCLGFNRIRPPLPCRDCVLMQLVPENSQNAKVPCRYIPLNERGDTLDSLYRSSSYDEIESAMKVWLKTKIAGLERTKTNSASKQLPPANRLRSKSAGAP